MTIGRIGGAVAAGMVGMLMTTAVRPATAGDVALVLAVDVSSSVDATRFRLQMEGIAEALEDESVQRSILRSAEGRVHLALVPWADRVEVAVPWRTLATPAEANALAADIRALPRRSGDYTCLARMLRQVRERVLADLPAGVERVVIDVSGDGIDNCEPTAATEAERDATVATGATINGLPILVPGENDLVGTGAYRAPGYDWTKYRSEPHAETGTTLPDWFRRHVVGGEGAFVLPAKGYGDFGRAFRRKFVTEVSGRALDFEISVTNRSRNIGSYKRETLFK